MQEDMLKTKKLKSPNWDTFDAATLSKQTAGALKKMEGESAEDQSSPDNTRRKQYFLSRHQGLQAVADARNEAGSGVVGVAAEVGWVRDERLDICLSRALGRLMQTVILHGTKDVVQWKTRLKGLSSNQQLGLLALDNFQHTPLDAEGKVRCLADPRPLPEGWVGYAANLVELEDKNVFLRPVFFNLLGNKAVFESIEKARAYRKYLVSRNVKCPYLLCLDGERMETTGIEWAGQQQADPGFRFGRMPKIASETYKNIQKLHRLFEQYHEMTVERDEERRSRPQVDPKNEETHVRSRHTDASARVKQMGSLLDQSIERVSLQALDALLKEVESSSTATQASQPAKRPRDDERSPAFDNDSGDEVANAEEDSESCGGKPPRVAKRRRKA